MESLDECERRLWGHVGLEPVTHHVPLPHVGTTVRVQEVGQGPPVVFIHGTSVAGATWATLVARLPGHRCLVLDRPGCGRSEPLPQSPDLGRLLAVADDLVADVLDGLDIPRAAVVATSRGALDGIRSTAAHPDRVERLLLYGWCMGAPGSVAPAWLRVASLPPLARLAPRMPASRRMVAASLRQFGLADALDAGRVPDELLDWMVALYRDTDTLRNETVGTPTLVTLRDGWADEIMLSDDTLAAVTMPASLVWGTADPFGGPDVARALAQGLPDAQLHLVAGAGHAPWLDDLDTCARAANVFLGGA